MKRNGLTVLLACLLTLAELGHAHAGVVWWSGQHSVSRLESATGQIRTLAASSRVRAIAPLADGGAWVVHGEALERFDAALHSTRVVVVKQETPDAPTAAAVAGDGGVWIAQGKAVARFDAMGALVTQWRHPTNVVALAVGGPNGVLIADATGVYQYTNGGLSARVIDLRGTGAPAAMLVDLAAGYLWVATSSYVIQFDGFAGFQERSRIALPPGTSATALDVTTGDLWLLSGHRLSGFDRDALPIASWVVPADTIADASALAVDALFPRLWIGDRYGTTTFNHESMQWIRLTGGDPTSAMAGSFFRIDPDITLADIAAGPPPRLRLQFGALCSGVPCVATPRYRRTFDLHARIAGVDITDRFSVNPDAGTADLSDIDVLAGTEPMHVSVSDGYGTRSADLVLDLVALSGIHAPVRTKANALPTVSISAPPNNARFVAPATITIAALAADSDGIISKVEFYRNSVLLGTDTTSPYSFAWTNVAVGTYQLTAKAYDNAGGATTSAIINVQVNANTAPTVSLSAPANNAAYTAPATINFAANATDLDGTIAKVEFFQGTTKLNTDTTAPYVFSWTGVAGGTYSLSAKATDDKGAVTTSGVITVSVNNPPTVALTAPADNTTLLTPASVTIIATASDSGGSVSKVEFFRDGVLLGTDTSSPYSFAWTNVPVGRYSLTAKATDNKGAVTVSAARVLTVVANQAPAITLTAPANGQFFVAGVPVTITATATDADGTIARVDFYRYTATYGNALIGTDTTAPYGIAVAMVEGANQLTAVAVDNKGASTTSAPVTVTGVANQLPSVTLTSPANGQSFPALIPVDITLTAVASDTDGHIVNVKFYYLPAPTPDNLEPVRVLIGTAVAPPYQMVWRGARITGTGLCDATGCSPYNYMVSAEAMDDAGGIWASDAFITVPNYSPWSLQISAPSDNRQIIFTAPATIVVAATTPTRATQGDPVAKVEFVADGDIIGTVVGEPNGTGGEYVHVWRNLGAGTHTLSARLYDTAGFMVEAAPIPVRIRDRTTPPVVAVSAPVHTTAFLPPIATSNPDIPITAVASDVDGAVVRTEIIVDDAILSIGAGSPLTATWNTVPIGLHVITASALDNGFANAVAKPIYVRVLPFGRLQGVVLTSPAPGAISSPLVLLAEVGAPDGGVEVVEFYDGATRIGVASAPPYRLVVAPGNGTHLYKARAVMFNNLSMASTPVAVTVSGANVLPNVSLTAPAAGQVFSVGSAIALAANASDSNGTVAIVQFIVGPTILATATTAPYTATWTPAAAGTYTLFARATDNQGGFKDSTAVSITVTANSPPTVSITSPVNGQSYFAGVPFAITANASDPGGAVSRVEFYAGSTLVGSTTSSPYAVNWSAPAAGIVVLTAKAIDNANAVTTSAGVTVTINANAIPTIALSMPRSGQTFVTGSAVTMVASASDGDGGIARVEFYAGATLLGTSVAAPYVFTWSSVASGSYSLTAKVVDSRGAVAISTAVAIMVQPLALNVTSPLPGASVAGDFILVTGTFVAPANSGITVNGVVATTDNQGTFFVNNFPLDAGLNTLEVTLTTFAGQTASTTVAVTGSGDAPFLVVADPHEGFAPLQVSLRFSTRNGVVTSVQVTNLGSGILDTSQYGSGNIGVVTFANPGIYHPQVTIGYDGGQIYTQALTVIVRDSVALDQSFLAMLVDFTEALRSGNKALAMQHLSAPLQNQIGPVIDALSPSMAQIIGTFKGFGAVSIDGDIATYAVRRDVSGKVKIFLFDILRDFDGVWRIDSM